MNKNRFGVICLANAFFNKNTKKACLWCEFGRTTQYSDDVFCTFKGVKNGFDCCRKYKYDPLKRRPESSTPSDNYSPDDFKL